MWTRVTWAVAEEEEWAHGKDRQDEREEIDGWMDRMKGRHRREGAEGGFEARIDESDRSMGKKSFKNRDGSAERSERKGKERDENILSGA